MLIIMFLVNIVGITMVYGILGLLIILALTGGAYFGLKAKIGDKKNLAEKLSIGVVFIGAVFAANSALGNPLITAVAAMVEFLVFILFINAKS